MKLMLLLPSSAWMTCRRLPPTYLRRSLLIRNFSVVVVVPNIEPWLDIERSLRKFWLSVAAILQIAAAFSSTEEEGLLEIESTLEKSAWHPIKAKFASSWIRPWWIAVAIRGQNMMVMMERVWCCHQRGIGQKVARLFFNTLRFCIRRIYCRLNYCRCTPYNL